MAVSDSTPKQKAIGIKSIGGIVGGVLAFVVAYSVVSKTTSGLLGGSVDAKVIRTVNEANKRVPIQLDEHTRLDRLEALPNAAYAYIYTLKLKPSNAEIDTLKARVSSGARSSPEMKEIFDAGITVWYKYHDEMGTLLFEFPVKK